MGTRNAAARHDLCGVCVVLEKARFEGWERGVGMGLLGRVRMGLGIRIQEINREERNRGINGTKHVAQTQNLL